MLECSEHTEVKSGLFLDVIVRKGAAILQLLAGEDQALLIRGDTLLILDLGLHVVDGVRGLHLERDGLPSEGLDEDLHTTTTTRDYEDTLVTRSESNSATYGLPR